MKFRITIQLRILTLFSLVLVGLFSCQNETEYRESQALVQTATFPPTVRVNEPFTIEMVILGSSGCSEFSRFESNIENDRILFEFFQKRQENQVCATVITEINVEIEFTINSTNINELSFGAESGTSLTIPIEVIN